MGFSRQDQLNWLRGRQNGIGSSDSPVLALPPEKVFNKSPIDIYISKIKPITIDDIDDGNDNPNFRRGHTYEPLAVAMFEAQTGIKVYAPVTSYERFQGFQVHDADSPLFADFDGFCEDGWVYEGKSPIQRVCDAYKTQGIKEYYMVQAQHLAHCANVCELPFLGADSKKWLGKIKGTRLVVYEPENVQLQIVELPIDHDIIGAIILNAKRFTSEHVQPKVPPSSVIYEQPVIQKASKGRYQEVTSDDWVAAIRKYNLVKEQSLLADMKLEASKSEIAAKMTTSGQEAIHLGPHKFLYRQVSGRKTFDRTALEADHPEIDLEKYMKQGAPAHQFNYYGPKEREQTGYDDLDSQVQTIHLELEAYGRKTLDAEQGLDDFEDLRERADLYASMLEIELTTIREGIKKAAEALIRKIG